MGPEIWIGVAAVFVAGGAIGTAGTLLTQWVLRKIDGPDRRPASRGPHRAELEMIRSEVAELNRHVYNLDTRLDFTEQLLGGAIPTTNPPGRLPSQAPISQAPTAPDEPPGATPPADAASDEAAPSEEHDGGPKPEGAPTSSDG